MMSSSSVCQGVQSHVESNPRLSGNNVGEEVEENCKRNGGEDCGVRRRRGNGGSGENEEKAYFNVHVGSSTMTMTRMSMKSLEMCTEGLGSESGSDMGEIENDDMCLLISLEVDDFASAPSVRSKANRRRRAASATTFPPLLTSVTEVTVESFREDGRLVLTAVATGSASRTSYFHAERTKGRLKLHLVKLKHMEEEEDDDDDQAYTPEDTEESNCSCSCSCKHTKELLNWEREPLWVST